MLSYIAAISFAFGTVVAQAFPPVTPSPVPAPPAPPKAAAPGAPSVVIPANTKVTVHLSSPLTSSLAQTGQSFGFFVDQDINLNGTTIPKCTPGTGTVSFAERSGGSGKEGTLKLVFDSLNLPDGTTVALDKTEQQFKGQDQHGKAARHRLGMYLLCGLLCQGGGANAVSGYEAVIPMDKEITVLVANETPDRPSATAVAPVCPTPPPAPTASPASR